MEMVLRTETKTKRQRQRQIQWQTTLQGEQQRGETRNIGGQRPGVAQGTLKSGTEKQADPPRGGGGGGRALLEQRGKGGRGSRGGREGVQGGGAPPPLPQ